MPVSFERLFLYFKRQYEATIIGVKLDGDQGLSLNPALNYRVLPGATLFYIADERLLSVDWSVLYSDA